MKELFKTLRLAFYVCALPLVITAAASAHTWIMSNQQDEVVPAAEAIQAYELPVAEEYNTMRPHVLCLDKDGNLNGQITAIGEDKNVSPGPMTVYISRGGKVVATTQSDANGEFTIPDLAPGQYSYVASGDSKFAAFGINVKPCDDSDTGQTLLSSAVSSTPFQIRKIMETRFPFEADKTTPTSIDANEDLGEVSSVQLRPDGTLNGIVRPFFGHPTVDGTKLTILQNDTVVAETFLGPDGKYSLANFETGVYDLVANGPHGFAAIAFRAVGFEGTHAALETESIRGPRAKTPPPAPQGDVVLTEPPGGDTTIIIIEQPMPIIIENIVDGGAGGTFGGSGGFGGLGGLSDLAGLIVGGWVLTELFDQIDFNDNNNNVNPPAPPVIPTPISPSS